MIRGKPERKFELIYEIYSRENNLLNIKWLCEIAGVSRSRYYRWLNAASDRAEKKKRKNLILKIFLMPIIFVVILKELAVFI